MHLTAHLNKRHQRGTPEYCKAEHSRREPLHGFCFPQGFLLFRLTHAHEYPRGHFKSCNFSSEVLQALFCAVYDIISILNIITTAILWAIFSLLVAQSQCLQKLFSTLIWFELFIIITNVYYFIKKIHTEAKSIPFHYNQEYKINARNS